MLIDRARDRPVRYLEWRVRFFGIGAILALVGMATGQTWMIDLAIGVLVVGFLLRFLQRREQTDDGQEAEPDPSRSIGR